MQVSACRLIVHVLNSIIHASFLQLFHATHIDWQISSVADSCTLAQCTHKNECATTKHKVIWNRLEMCMCCVFTDERARDTQRNCIQSHRPNGKQSTNHDHWSSHSCSAHQLFSIQVDCFLFCCCSCCSLDKCTPVPLRRWCTTANKPNEHLRHMSMKQQQCARFTLDACLKFITRKQMLSYSFAFLSFFAHTNSYVRLVNMIMNLVSCCLPCG